MNPLEEYGRRQAKWTAEQQLAQRAFVTIGNWRLFTAVVAAALAWFAFGRNALSGWWLLAPLFVFIALVVWHQRVLSRRTCAERGIRFYDQAIHRVQDTWSGRGSQGEEFRDPNHIYADDLDVFGKGSLFELISSARTAAGERTLANWLLTPATFAEAKERQEAVRELATKIDLREDIALLGEDIKSPVTAELLKKWGAAPAVEFPSFLRAAAFVLSLIGLATVALKLAEIWPLWPILVVLAVNVTVIFFIRKQIAQVDEAVETAAHQLSLFSLLIGRLEHEHFTSSGLTRLRSALVTAGLPASRRIKHLDRWLEVLDSSDHVILRVLGPLLLYKQQIVMAIEAWRKQNGAAIGNWIQALAEFEALSSIGALHYERPAWNFPTLEDSTSAHFAAVDIGHPLLPSSVAVRNSLTLDSACRLLIVSGSNMSGKSTLLRAVGLNAVLAWAGARCARKASLFRVFRSAHPSACLIRCRTTARASSPRSAACARLSTSPKVPFRFCSCWTNYSAAPTHTIAVSERRASCAGCWLPIPWGC